jgi:hypothetical protein
MIKQKMWERDNLCTLSGRFIQRFPIRMLDDSVAQTG